MSGSDSENDYASADEDTTEESSTAQKSPGSETTEEKSKSAQKIPGSETTEEKSKSAQKIPGSETTEEKSKSVIVTSSENNKKSDFQKNSDINLSADRSKGAENSVALSGSELTTVEEKRSEEPKSSAGHVIDSQPKRVQLRLEKKIQQKSRTASLESQKSEEAKNSVKSSLPVSSSSWGSWGSSLLSTAAASVSTFTNQVSQGIGTVIEHVELMGPQPCEELAELLREKREQQEREENVLKEQASFEDDTGSVENEEKEAEVNSIGSFTTASNLLTSVTSLTKVIENTGTKVIMGGLDTLELIGKKTIDIITEGDPGLRKKRSAFNKGVNLSQILREAKQKAEADQANMSIEDQEDAVYYSRYFDEKQGLSHLEALEMLSNQCQQKVQGALMVSGESEEKEMLNQISRICEDLPSADETPDDEVQDFNAAISVHVKELQIPFNLKKIKQVHASVISYLESATDQPENQMKDIKEIYRQAISSLAEFTACCVEQFHKFGELILVQTGSDFDVLMCATHLTGLTSVLCVEISSFATRYCQHLNSAASGTKDETASAFITNTYLEASNSTTYIQDAFQLLVPVLQSATLK